MLIQPSFVVAVEMWLIQVSMEKNYKREHLRLGFWCKTGQRTARIASSNTVFNPFCVNAEHSKYFTAPISLAIAKPYNQLQKSLINKISHFLLL
jgi:hypothetical protein